MRFMRMMGLVALVVSSLGLAGAARAAPLSPAPLAGDANGLIQVGYWCGPRFHLNPWGRCVPNVRRFYGPGPAFYGAGYYGRRRFYRTSNYRWHRTYRWHRNYRWHRSYHWRRR